MRKSKFSIAHKAIRNGLTIIAIAINLLACSEQKGKIEKFAAAEAVKKNVLYLGVDNPLKIAVAGLCTSELEVTIDNGTIVGDNGDYIALPESTVPANITITHNGEEVRKVLFRVRNVPDPVVGVKGLNERKVDKNELIEASELEVLMPDWFSFDLDFKIESFTASANIGGFTVTQSSNSHSFTEGQKNMIQQLRSGQIINFIDIMAVGPDGYSRKLNDLVFEIK